MHRIIWTVTEFSLRALVFGIGTWQTNPIPLMQMTYLCSMPFTSALCLILVFDAFQNQYLYFMAQLFYRLDNTRYVVPLKLFLIPEFTGVYMTLLSAPTLTQLQHASVIGLFLLDIVFAFNELVNVFCLSIIYFGSKCTLCSQFLHIFEHCRTTCCKTKFHRHCLRTWQAHAAICPACSI